MYLVIEIYHFEKPNESRNEVARYSNYGIALLLALALRNEHPDRVYKVIGEYPS
jgi:hypothetical protein